MRAAVTRTIERANAGPLFTGTTEPLKIRFFVPGVPRSLQVGTTVHVNKTDGTARRFQRRRNPGWAKRIALFGLQYRPPAPSPGPIIFELVAYVPRPMSAVGQPFPLGPPDAENLANKLTDSWNGRFWTDDAVIVDYIVRKRWADVESGVSVRIDEVR